MTIVPISRQDGRVNQKERTRAALVDAATVLFREGASPTVAEAAEKAKVSRATAYRYFPTQESLLLEVAAVSPVVTPVEKTIAELSGDDVEARLMRVFDSFTPIVLEQEAPLRAALGVYLDTWLEARRDGKEAPKVREGRRMRWLDATLAPARGQLTKRQWERLRAALALTLGIDAVVVMKDVCHLDDAETEETLRWTASALLRAALEEAATTPSRKKR
jgi:AcrR family transcriptional regulator